MRIHCTKALAEKMSKAGHCVTADSEKVTSLSMIGSWHANLCNIQRRRCLVFCHDQSRFILTLPYATQKDLKSLDYWFQDLLVNTLAKSGVDSELIENSASFLTGLEFDTKCDRSVQGTLNQVIQELKFIVEYEGLSIDEFPLYSMGARLSERPCSVKRERKTEFLYPKREMINILSSLPLHLRSSNR